MLGAHERAFLVPLPVQGANSKTTLQQLSHSPYERLLAGVVLERALCSLFSLVPSYRVPLCIRICFLPDSICLLLFWLRSCFAEKRVADELKARLGFRFQRQRTETCVHFLGSRFFLCHYLTYAYKRRCVYSCAWVSEWVREIEIQI